MDKLWLKYTPEEVYRRKKMKKNLMYFVVLPVLAIVIGFLSAYGANSML